MLDLRYTNQIKRDLRLIKNRGKDLNKLKAIIDLVVDLPSPSTICFVVTINFYS